MARIHQKEVHQYTSTGKYIQTHESIALAASRMEVTPSAIYKAIKNKSLYKGYFWCKNPNK